MCGIVGIYSPLKRIEEKKLLNATKSLSHRGPDAQNIWISSNKNVGLGHARLSIIDLENGNQPLSNTKNTIHTIVNGELYGYEEIRKQLLRKGYSFKTNSDSEVVLYLYEEYGLNFATHLRGEFAIILWDSNKNQLIAVRDRFGIKPLYYTRHEDDYYFASEVKAIQAAGVPLKWDEENLFHSFNLMASIQDKSLFSGINQLSPGYLMIINVNGENIKQYWDSDFPQEKNNKERKSDDDYIEEFKSVLEESVKIRLRADVPIACYLSGGIDSSSVAGISQKYLNSPLHTFTLAFEDDEYNEAIYAQETAEKIGSIHQMVHVSANDLTDNFADAIWAGEILAVNAHVAAKFMLSKVVRNAGFKVVLTGEGSDEMLAGYPHFKKDLITYEYQGKSSEEKEKLLAQLEKDNILSKGILLPEGIIKDLKIQKQLGYSPTWMQSYVSIGKTTRTLLNESFYHKFTRLDSYNEALKKINIKNKLTGVHPVNQSLYLWGKLSLPNYILTMLGDRMEMGHGVEGRVPFLDHHLAELAQKLPVDLKIRGQKEKYILREAAKEVLTKTMYERQKHPFVSAPSTSKKNEKFFEFMETTLRSGLLKKLPIFDEKKILRFLDTRKNLAQDKQATSEAIALRLTSACIIADRFNLS